LNPGDSAHTRPTHYESQLIRMHRAHPVHPCTSRWSRCSNPDTVLLHFRARTVPRWRSTQGSVQPMQPSTIGNVGPRRATSKIEPTLYVCAVRRFDPSEPWSGRLHRFTIWLCPPISTSPISYACQPSACSGECPLVVDLARGGPGDLVDEDDRLGQLVPGDPSRAMFDQCAGVHRAPSRSATSATTSEPHRSLGRPQTAVSATFGVS